MREFFAFKKRLLRSFGMNILGWTLKKLVTHRFDDLECSNLTMSCGKSASGPGCS